MHQKSKVIFKNSAKSSRNPKAYWNTLKRINKANYYPIKIRDPDNPERIIDDPVEMRKVLTSYWRNLSSQPTNPDTNLKDTVDRLQNTSPQPGSLHAIILNDDTLTNAIKKLKNAKATGPDNLPGEFLKHCDENAKSAFLDVLCLIKLTEKIPSDWCEGIKKPLHKEGNREILSNYRGITISSVAYKTLVIIMEDQIMKYMEENGIFGEVQGAFRKGRRCEDHIFSLKSICAIRKSKKQKTYLAFLDISKAFDTLNRNMLFNYIHTKGIQGKAWAMVKMLYEQVDNRVIFGNIESEVFSVTAGVKQGCVLSPCLFNLVITDLDQMLRNCGGVDVGQMHIDGLYYADDIVLIGQNEQQLNLMLGIADRFARKWDLKYNSKKSKVLIVGKRISDKKWQLGTMSLDETNCYKYLGVILNRQMKDGNHIKEHISSKVSNLDGYIRYTLAKHADINRVKFGNSLWYACALPSIKHACAIWFNDTKSSKDMIKSYQYKCGKAVLKIRSNPSRSALLGDLGWLPILDELDIARAAYFLRLKKLDEGSLAKQAYYSLYDMYNQGIDTNFGYFKNMKEIFVSRGMDQMFKEEYVMKTVKDGIRHHHCSIFEQEINNMSSLKLYRSVRSSQNMASYLCSTAHFKSVQLKFKLRSGILGLGADLHRQKRGDGLCKHCGSFESARHFVLHCAAYSRVRHDMYLNIKKSVDTDMFNLILQYPELLLVFLLGDYDDTFNILFLDYLSKAWSIRNEF